MLCDVCKKNKAIVHYTEVIDDKIKKINLCEECAASKGAVFSLGELLGGFASGGRDTSILDKQLICPECGMSFAEFKTRGRLGCPACYNAFSANLMPVLGDIHKSVKHTGKFPKSAKASVATVSKLRDLEIILRDAVNKEEFERAASIRDQIRNLSQNKKKTKD